MITQERLKELLHYDPETGIFMRITSPLQRNDLLGKVAGHNTGSGYKRICIDGYKYYCHRLAWLYMTGNWPDQEIDHISGKRDDNSWGNLRDVSRKINAQNFTKPRSDNKSGYLGVSFDKQKKKWVARIKIENVYKFLGYFFNKEEAHQAYIKGKREYHKGCTI